MKLHSLRLNTGSGSITRPPVLRQHRNSPRKQIFAGCLRETRINPSTYVRRNPRIRIHYRERVWTALSILPERNMLPRDVRVASADLAAGVGPERMCDLIKSSLAGDLLHPLRTGPGAGTRIGAEGGQRN